jgi:hypothetical protein
MAFATSDMKTTTVIRCLKSVITFFPELRMIISDNQTSLCRNEKVRQYLATHNIEPRTTIPYSSQSNYAETANRLIRKILRAYELTFGRSWLFCFEHSINALNANVHSTGPFQGLSPFEIIFNKSPSNSDPFHHLRNTKRLVKQKLKLKNEIDRVRTLNHQQIVKAKQDVSEIKAGALVRLHNQTRTNKQSPYFLADTFKVISRRGYEVILESTSDERIKQRAHLKFVKLCRPISESILLCLRPEQRHLLGYEKDMSIEGQSNPCTAPSLNSSNSSSDSDDSDHKHSDKTKSIRSKSTKVNKEDDQSSIGPDDSISQRGSQAGEQGTSTKAKKKNIFKRVFNFLQNKTGNSSPPSDKSSRQRNVPFLEKVGSFKFGSFRPANISTPQIEPRRSKRLKNQDKIDYNLFNKTGQKKKE